MASSTQEGAPKVPRAPLPEEGRWAPAYSTDPRSSLGLGKYYQDMTKNFYKSNLDNRNFFKVWKNFLLWPVKISFFNRLNFLNGASWTTQTLDGQYNNFRSSFKILSLNFKIHKNKKIEICLNFLNFSGLKSRLGLAKYYQDM